MGIGRWTLGAHLLKVLPYGRHTGKASNIPPLWLQQAIDCDSGRHFLSVGETKRPRRWPSRSPPIITSPPDRLNPKGNSVYLMNI